MRRGDPAETGSPRVPAALSDFWDRQDSRTLFGMGPSVLRSRAKGERKHGSVPVQGEARCFQPLLGTFMRTVSPPLAEILGYAGLDFVIVDAEHGAGSLESMENMVRAAQLVGLAPLVRVRYNSPHEIVPALDAGFLGVQIPHVTSRQDALEAVQAAKYSPLGHRGVSVSSRVAHFGARPAREHMEAANRETVVVLQIEDAEGVQNLPDILEVAGVDIIFVGQNDLSQSLGHAGDTGHSDVQEAVQRCIDLCREKGMTVGTSARTPEAVKKWGSKGMTYLCGNAEVMMLGFFSDFVRKSQDALNG